MGVTALLAAALLVGAVGMVGCKADTESTDGESTGNDTSGEPIKIGAILSLSGTYAGLGEPERNAIELELARINEAGGVNGRPVEVIIEDDATDEAQAVTAASKLIDQDGVVAIIGATGTGQTMAVRSDIQRAGIPQVSMAGGNVITGEFDPLVFQTPWPNRLIIPYVLKMLAADGMTKIAVITDTGGYGKDGLAILEESAPDAQVEIVAKETFNAGDTDMTTQLTKIKGSEAQAIVMWTAGAEASTIAKNREQLAIDLPLVAGSGIARRQFIDGAGSAAEGVVFVTGKILLPETYGEDTDEYKVATDFIERYEAEYDARPDIFAGHAYDALWLVVEAAKRLEGEFTPAELRDEIEATEGWVGIDGTFTFSESDHNGLTEKDLTAYRITDGEWVATDSIK